MHALLTFLVLIAVGVALATGAQMASIPAGAGFMLGMAYVIVVSLVLNTRGARA